MPRIGFNDISQEYAVGEDHCLPRYQNFLKSVLYTYVEPSGAMRGTQNPHILNFEGVMTISHGVLPAPTISPLAGDYKEQVKAIAQALDGNGLLETREFANTAEFAGILQEVIQGTRPYRLFNEKGA